MHPSLCGSSGRCASRAVALLCKHGDGFAGVDFPLGMFFVVFGLGRLDQRFRLVLYIHSSASLLFSLMCLPPSAALSDLLVFLFLILRLFIGLFYDKIE